MSGKEDFLAKGDQSISSSLFDDFTEKTGY